MEERRASASLFGQCAVVVVGRAPEVTSELAGAPLVRLAVGAAVDVDPPAAAVFDLRDGTVADLAAMRSSPLLSTVPLLLVAADEVPETVFSLLGADDAVVISARSAGTLSRRLSRIVELGQLRLALSFADQALEHSVSGLSIADVGASPSDASPVFERLAGFGRADEVVRSPMLRSDDVEPSALSELRAGVADRRRATVLVKDRRRDGSPIWNELTIFPLVAHGQPTRWMAGVQHDVSELVEVHAHIEWLYRRLVDKQRFDHAILDGVDVGIVTTDDRGIVTFANRMAIQLLQLVPDATGSEVAALLGLAQGPQELLDGEERRVFGCRLSTPDGGELDLELSLSRGDGDRDQRVGFFFIFRDVGEEKQREEERRRFERLASMGTMVAGFAHEVRNPVAAMRSIAEELSEELRDSGVHTRHVGLLLQMVERVERLVRTSLQFGRPAAPKRAPQRPWVILSSAITELHPRLRDLGGEMVLDVESDLPDVNVDERQLAQALVILINNALDATGSASRVTLRVRRARLPESESRLRRSEPPPAGPPSVRFDVIDDGPGISPQNIGRIFDPFFTTKPTGTGLGLSIAQQIASENGARLEVMSLAGPTTCFSLWAPTELRDDPVSLLEPSRGA